jgi:type II secretory pathway component PulF
VLIVSLGLTIVISLVAKRFVAMTSIEWVTTPPFLLSTIWLPPILIGVLLAAALVVLSVPKWRAQARWRLPGFRETSLAQLAAAIALMLKSGTPFPEALAFAESIESDSPAAGALRQWRSLLQEGQGKPAQWPQSLRPFPPMFLWLVRKGGEDMSAGFQKAAEIYRSRASYKIELLLYGALPMSVLLLGQMVIWQVAPVFRMLVWLMNSLGGDMGN